MGILGISFGSSSKKQSGNSTTTVTPWDETAPAYLSGLGRQSGDLADILGTQLTGWEMPYQQALYGANMGMLPYQAGAGMLSQEELMRDILAGRDVKDAIRDQYLSAEQKTAPVSSRFYSEAMKGFDPTKEANEAEANVIRSMAKAKDAYMGNLGSYGINPNRVAGGERAFDIAQAENIVGAREGAADQAKRDSFERLLNAMQVRSNDLGRSLTSLGALNQVSPLSSQGQFGTDSTLNSIINAISTGGNIYSNLLQPRTETTNQTGKISGSSTGIGIGYPSASQSL